MVEVELADTGNGAGYKLPVASKGPWLHRSDLVSSATLVMLLAA